MTHLKFHSLTFKPTLNLFLPHSFTLFFLITCYKVSQHRCSMSQCTFMTKTWLEIFSDGGRMLMQLEKMIAKYRGYDKEYMVLLKIYLSFLERLCFVEFYFTFPYSTTHYRASLLHFQILFVDPKS